MAHVTYGHLIVFDERKGKFLPELAKSWKRISYHMGFRPVRRSTLADRWNSSCGTTYFFTSGNKFTAADVKYIIDYVKDPKLKTDRSPVSSHLPGRLLHPSGATAGSKVSKF